MFKSFGTKQKRRKIVARDGFQGPVIGVYRECEDGEFLEEAQEFLEENYDLIQRGSSRVGNDMGVTIYPGKFFDALARESKHEFRVTAREAREHRESVLAPQIGEWLKLNLNGSIHYDIDSIATRVQDELDSTSRGQIKATVSTPARLERRIKGKRNRKQLVHFGVEINCPEGRRRISSESTLVSEIARLSLFGDLASAERREGRLPRPHITLAKAHTDKAYTLSREWTSKRRPGVVVLGPPNVRIINSETKNK